METVIFQFEKMLHKLQQKQVTNKVAFLDATSQVTYQQLYEDALFFAYKIICNTKKNDVVCLLMQRGVPMAMMMLACIYAGTPYVILDDQQPIDRIIKIIKIANPSLIIYDEVNLDKCPSLNAFCSTFFLANKDQTQVDNFSLLARKKQIIATDPLYILFTSGSTGEPKGTVITHHNVCSYIEWFVHCFHLNRKTIFANQTPFYFSMSVSDYYATLLTGATMVIVPKSYFSFPVKLFEMMNEFQVNTIYWVPSVYRLIYQFKLLDYIKPKYLKLALFAGEVMPTKILNDWMDHLPKVQFCNLFGPTETTDICTYFKVNRRFANNEALPIGNACENLEVFLINENHQKITDHSVGELIVKGPFVASGYYHNPSKTKNSFIQNPLQKNYPEVVYRTGDLCYYNENHELMYVSRIDFQIKHLGYRIELGEIETIINANLNIKIGFCIYDKENDNILCFYEGKTEKKELNQYLVSKLPYYMIPKYYIKLNEVKLNQNGKIDRKYYQNYFNELLKEDELK